LQVASYSIICWNNWNWKDWTWWRKPIFV